MTTSPSLILAHGSLRTAGFRERVSAAAAAGFDAIGLHAREYGNLRADGWSDGDIRAVLDAHGITIAEIETALGWDEPPDRRPPDGFRREELAFALADAVGARHLVAVGSLEGTQRPFATEGFAALCDRAAEHGLLVALEPQACSSIGDLAQATDIVRGADRPNGGLNLDVWHRTRGGWPQPALEALPAQHIVVIQVDDGPRTPVTDDYLQECTRYRSAPGTADFDVTGFVSTLLSTGATAPISVEVLSDELDRQPAAQVAELLATTTRQVVAAATAA